MKKFHISYCKLVLADWLELSRHTPRECRERWEHRERCRRAAARSARRAIPEAMRSPATGQLATCVVPVRRPPSGDFDGDSDGDDGGGGGGAGGADGSPPGGGGAASVPVDAPALSAAPR